MFKNKTRRILVKKTDPIECVIRHNIIDSKFSSSEHNGRLVWSAS